MFTRLVIIALLMFEVVSCKKNSSTARVKDDVAENEQMNMKFDFTKCSCGDTACWENETKAKTLEQINCAKDAMSTALPVVGAAITIIDKTIDIYETTDDLKKLVSGLDSFKNALKIVQAYSPGCFESGAGVAKNLAQIMAKSASTIEKIKKLTSGMDKSSYIGLQDITEVGRTVSGVVEGFTGTIESMNETVKCMDDALAAGKVVTSEKENVSTLKRLMTGFRDRTLKLGKTFAKQDVLGKIDAITTIANCGVGIVKGIHTLYQNSACLAEDFREIAKQKEMILRQKGALASGKALGGSAAEASIKANPDLCLNESKSNSVSIMGKFGAYYATNTLKGRDEDSYEFGMACAKACGDKGDGGVCSNFLSSQDFGVGCKNFCETKQESSATSNCVSNCCTPSEACYKIAGQIAGINIKELQERQAAVSGNANSMGNYCGDGANQGAGKEIVRDQNGTYVTYTPIYTNCNSCCSTETFENGGALSADERSDCTNVCVGKGKSIGKTLNAY